MDSSDALSRSRYRDRRLNKCLWLFPRLDVLTQRGYTVSKNCTLFGFAITWSSVNQFLQFLAQ